MTRLLALFEYATLNGGERSWLATLDAVRDAGFDVTAAAPPTGPLAMELARRAVPVMPLEYQDATGRRRDLKDLRESLRQGMREHKTELLHANSLNTARLSGPVAHELNVYSLGYLRDILKLRAAVVADLNLHDRLLAVSHAARDFHITQGVAPERVEVNYNGVDLHTLRPREATGYLHDELAIPHDAPLVATIGQIGLRKGMDTFVCAAAGLSTTWRHDLPRPHHLIIGERHSQKDESVQFEQRLRDASATDPLNGHLHFLGWRDDIPTLLPELTALAHPARQEPLGRVLLEAAACGVPVVATDVGGTREIFPPEAEAALVVPVDDALAMQQALDRVLSDRALQTQLSSAARRRVEQAFNRDDSAARLIDHYRSVLLQR